jgi:hypothetical protein
MKVISLLFMEDGMLLARTGSTCIPFSMSISGHSDSIDSLLPMNSHMPSSYWKKSLGGIRYLVAAVVTYKTGLRVRIPLASYQEIEYVENTDVILSPNWYTPTKCLNSSFMDIPGGLFNFGKKGVIKLGIHPCTFETMTCVDSGIWIAGTTGYVHVDIDNGTQKEVIYMFLKV